MSETNQRDTFLPNIDLTLYDFSISRSFRVRWVAQELGIADRITLKHVKLLEGAQNAEDFKKMNKMSSVPVLVLKDTKSGSESIVTESCGICAFLTEQIPGTILLPPVSNVFGRAQYHRFISFAAASMDPLLWDVRCHEELYPEEMRIPAVAKLSRRKFIMRVVKALEDVLGREGVSWICGPYYDEFTTADVVVGYGLFWAERYSLLDDSPVLQAYFLRVKEREACGKAGTFKVGM